MTESATTQLSGAAAFYDRAYRSNGDLTLREIGAADKVDNIVAAAGISRVKRLIDIGAGDGSVSADIARRGLAEEITCVDIAPKCVDIIRGRDIPGLKRAEVFDGYNLPAPGGYDLAVLCHVLEHAEQPRRLLREIARAAKAAVIEVPLELNLRLKRNWRQALDTGHINHYNPASFESLLRTSGFRVERMLVTQPSRPFLCAARGNIGGNLRWGVRGLAMKLTPPLAQALFTLNATAYVVPDDTDTVYRTSD